MKANLFFKYLVCYLLIVISSLLILNTVGAGRIRNGIIEDNIKSMKAEAETITSDYMKGYYSGNMSIFDVDNGLKTIDTFAGARIMIVNAVGEVISDSRGPSFDENKNRRQLPQWLLARDSYIGGNIKELSENSIVAVISPIDIDFVLKGYVVISMEMSGVDKEAAYSIDTLNICFLILGLVFFIALLFLYRISIVPLRAVIKGAREYAKGNFDYKLKEQRNRHDEFRDLMDTIEYMAKELSLIEEYQRKFISNISHDFRSPLTSIKGFATAMIDGTIPPELYNKYLNTICFETDRLTKLTSGLIELGKFDSHQALLDIKEFNLHSMIKQTVETFEGRCREKHIFLNLIFEGDAALVMADKGKIEQVFYNLIDNAIKFSQNDAEINITTRAKGNKVIVSVKDYGIGIPKESLKKIWERFYKTDPSRGKDKKGSGLGLSIVKEIIQSHGEEIDVISTENAGTEFVFTLSKSGV
ncbi:MAG: HAMP domain-containing sensor histidine kinase [Catonella sp.]|uniref:HAMP domain-containing sensor histidine kinase n=1 Tax=Catonella sp. TaxID=2382125 RepID=UPI003FA0F7C8